MKKNITLFLIELIILINSCDKFEPDHKIAFVNNSDSDVYCSWGSHYPDTLKIEYHTVAGDHWSKVNAHSKVSNIIPGLYDWVSIIETIPSDTLLIFVLDANTMDSIGPGHLNWNPIYHSMDDKQMYDWLVKKHFTLSVEDLERLDWTITYP